MELGPEFQDQIDRVSGGGRVFKQSALVNLVGRDNKIPPCEQRRRVECCVHPSMDPGKFCDFRVQKIKREGS
jgi:hypothetical protein